MGNFPPLAYAKDTGRVTICVECVNRFETFFLNIAEDAVRFCKDVGTGNVKVHLDCFHMIREEKSFSGAVMTCGKEYLGYVHVNENDRGIPGTGLVPFPEFFQALADIGYSGPLVIESFDPSFTELAGNCAIWRSFAASGEALAMLGREKAKHPLPAQRVVAYRLALSRASVFNVTPIMSLWASRVSRQSGERNVSAF